MIRRREVLALAASATVSACAAGGRGEHPRSLSIAIPGDPTTLDPAATLLGENLVVPDMVYERLVRYRVGGGRPIGVRGELARDWTVAPDGGSITFHLEPGHRFDDGTEVDAAAVKFTFDRLRRDKLAAAQGLMWLEGVTVVDPRTIRLDVAMDPALVLMGLASPAMGVVNPAVRAYTADGDLGSAWLARNTAGSGAYKVVRFAQREEAVLRPNPHALHKPVWFDDVRVRVVKDDTIGALQLAKGDIDILAAGSTSVATRILPWLADQPGVTAIRGLTPQVVFLHLNNERGIFRDRRVREAVSLAINREAIIQDIFRGHARRTHGALPFGDPAEDQALPLPAYDPVRARALLKEAGVKPGTRVVFTSITASSSPSAMNLAMVRDLNAVGLDVEVRQIAAAARSKILKGDFDMTVQTILSDFPDPWILMNFGYNSALIGAGNWSRYRNAEVDALLARADATRGEVRLDAYRQAQRLIARDWPNAILFQTQRGIAYRSELQGMNYNFAQQMLFNVAEMRRGPGASA